MYILTKCVKSRFVAYTVTMNVLFFAFANNELNPLPTLQREANELFRLLSPGEMQQRYILYVDRFATREKIAYYLTQYKDNIALFHYSGHAGRDALHTEDEVSHAGGIAHLLGQCPKLKMVFLNGCSTQGQLKALQEKGIPGIMATSSPVEDKKATDFSIRFYQALSVQDKLETAFELAKGEVLTQDPNLSLGLHRDFVLEWSDRGPVDSTLPQWGLFVDGKQEEVLNWQLPQVAIPPPTTDFTPNELLIDTLIEALAPYAREVKNIKRDEEDGEEVDFADKRLAILNSLPAPIAEQLRKLMVPLGDSDKGFDKIGAARADQLAKTAQTIIELFTYTLLAQLWDSREAHPELQIAAQHRDILLHFFEMKREEKENFQFIPLLEVLHKMLQELAVPRFIKELDQLKDSYQQGSAFFMACHYLAALKRRLNSDELAPHEIPEACRQGEASLAAIFKELGFLANYTLAAVRMIDVVKFRHNPTATFRHSLVRLVKLMGGLEEKSEDLDEYMDNRSVLLLRKPGKKNETPDPSEKKYLNLSPFVIDENAFDEKNSDVSKVYFFHYFDKALDKYVFRHAYKPDDMPLIVSNEKYNLVKMQFEAFRELMFGTEMSKA